MNKVCRLCHLGKLDYRDALQVQRRLVEDRAAERAPDTLLLLEHPPTYTLGPRGDEAHILASPEELESKGAVVYRVDRGGDVTFHGPGQLVGYPVLDLSDRSSNPGWISRYLRDLEESIIQALRAFGLRSTRIQGFTGVWVGDAKIAAIGVKMSARRITSHGFALNVNNDMSYFDCIVPCGIRDKRVTSLELAIGDAVTMSEVMDEVATAFGHVFGMSLEGEQF